MDSDGGGLLLGVVPWGCGMGTWTLLSVMVEWTGEVQYEGMMRTGVVGAV